MEQLTIYAELLSYGFGALAFGWVVASKIRAFKTFTEGSL